MLSNTPEASAAAPRPPAEARPTEPLPKLDLSKPIEVASSGTGGTNDTSGTYKPPGLWDTRDPAADC